MAGTQRSYFERATPIFPMVNLENGDGVGRYKESAHGSSTSTSLASSPTEAAYLTSNIDVERTVRQSQVVKVPSFLQCLPAAFVKLYETAASWLKAPQSTKTYQITPVFERLQTAPIRSYRQIAPSHTRRALMLCGYYILWLFMFVIIIHKSTMTGEIDSYEPPVRLSCISRLWPNSTYCGLNGDDCRPFDQKAFAFNCPAGCKAVKVLNPHMIGAEEINYRSLLVGGPTASDSAKSSVYRGDSFVCGAAIHAGIVKDQRGGCGIVSLLGERSDFPSVEMNGMQSVAFNSSFPLSFSVSEPDFSAQQALSQCSDPRWRLLGLSVIFTSVLSTFTTSSAIFFSSVFTGIFFHVALASDPPDFRDFSSVASAAVGRFLPAAFVGLGIYWYCVRRTLHGLQAQLEKTILWLGSCWVGALSNSTFDKIPIQRLTPHDLKQQPGAVPALLFIIGLLLAIAFAQAWAFRIEGRLLRYLGLYAAMGTAILLLLAVPGLKLRIHHYVLALLLLPGTSLQTRPSLLYQGLLVGLFINGIARWDFASILQTPAALLEDGQIGSLVPEVMAPVITASNITFTWHTLAKSFDGISVLVNDVERYRGFQDRGDLNFTWKRSRDWEDEYFRFAYVKYGHLGGPWIADYTKTGIWQENGNWVPIPSPVE